MKKREREHEKGCPADSISTRRIKSFALSHLPQDHPLRQVILAERETLRAEEFVAKMEVWLILIDSNG
jgi:hypothetical protein